MTGLSRAAVSGLCAVALAATGLTTPAVASVPGGKLKCTYHAQPHIHQVSGSCEGTTDLGSASGSFTGKLRPQGGGHGKIALDTPRASSGASSPRVTSPAEWPGATSPCPRGR
jgi:hypothetical protein